MKLYHFTSRVAAADILRSGFKPGADGTVWFAEHPTVIWGNDYSEVLLEIVVSPVVVTPHKIPIEEEVQDPISGGWTPSQVVEVGNYFALPQDVANRYKPRRVSNDERRMMMT